MEITPLDPDDPDQLDAWTRLRNAGESLDCPTQRPVTPAREAGRFKHGWDGEPTHAFLGRVDGQVVAGGSIATSEYDNLDTAWLEVRVHPEHRRRGLGSAMLHFLDEEATRRGRSLLGGECWDVPAAIAFAARHRFEPRSVVIQRRQHLDELDLADVHRLRAEAAAHARDYEVELWGVPTPEDRLESLAEMASAINDAPTDDLEYEDEVFSAARMRGYEDAMVARGQRLHRLVVRHRPTGELAGQTVVGVEEEEPDLGHQHDTSVVRAHRGHRLGLLLKAAMVEHLLRAEPQLRVVETWNAESNDHMIGVNELLGYRITGRELALQRPR